MELKVDEFEVALQLKNAYFASDCSRDAFEKIISSAGSNYWSKRWLADIYRQGKEPFGYFGSLGEKAFYLYGELARANSNDFYSLFRSKECYMQDWAPLGNWRQSILRSEKTRQHYELLTISCAAHLAISKDPEALIGLRYLEAKLKEMTESTSKLAHEVKVKTLMLLAIVKNDRQLWEQAKKSDKKIFNEYVASILSAESLVATPFMQSLPLKCEVTYTSNRSYSLLDEQPAVAPSTTPLTQLVESGHKEEQYPSIYPKLESRVEERENSGVLLTNFNRTLQLIVSGGDKKDEKRPAKEVVVDQAAAEQRSADTEKDLIIFDDNFPAVPTAEPMFKMTS